MSRYDTAEAVMRGYDRGDFSGWHDGDEFESVSLDCLGLLTHLKSDGKFVLRIHYTLPVIVESIDWTYGLTLNLRDRVAIKWYGDEE